MVEGHGRAHIPACSFWNSSERAWICLWTSAMVSSVMRIMRECWKKRRALFSTMSEMLEGVGGDNTKWAAEPPTVNTSFFTPSRKILNLQDSSFSHLILTSFAEADIILLSSFSEFHLIPPAEQPAAKRAHFPCLSLLNSLLLQSTFLPCLKN